MHFTAVVSTLLVIWSCSHVCETAIWPQPKNQSSGQGDYELKSWHFKFVNDGFESDTLHSAFKRYSSLLFEDECGAIGSENFGSESISLEEESNKHKGHVTKLIVSVASMDQSLNLETDESYALEIKSPYSSLQANSVYGAIRGLESFAQLLTIQPDKTENNRLMDQDGEEYFCQDSQEGLQKRKHRKSIVYKLPATSIQDAPRFPHRGLLIDTARHFLPLPIILKHLDAMAMSKLNVLHWHIIDDQSFPLEIESMPELSGKGAFKPDLVYTAEDVETVVSYARLRGIRVIPEIDTPGHTLSWGHGYPELLTDCYDEKGHVLETKGPLDPSKNETYAAVWKILQDVFRMFPDTYLHLGGDEVPFDCWQSNPDIKKWMESQSPPITDLADLERSFEERVFELTNPDGRSYIVWQEIADNGIKIKDEAIVHVWKWWWPTTPSPPEIADSSKSSLRDRWNLFIDRSQEVVRSVRDSDLVAGNEKAMCKLSSGCMPAAGFEEDPPAWTKELERVTKKGFRTLLSSPWYLNLGGFASNDWAKYYSVEPLAFNGSNQEKELILGGEACMWGEYVDETNAIQRTWPRAAAVAERLWSQEPVRDIQEAHSRIEEHRCRLVARGVEAEPIGPGFCP